MADALQPAHSVGSANLYQSINEKIAAINAVLNQGQQELNDRLQKIQNMVTDSKPGQQASEHPSIDEENVSDQILTQDTLTVENSPNRGEIPEWYMHMEVSKDDVPRQDKEMIIVLQWIRSQFKELKELIDSSRSAEKTDIEERLRTELWKLRYKPMNAKAVKFKRGLELLLEMSTSSHIPWDMRSDCRMIYKDWANQHFDAGNLIRGMKLSTSRLKCIESADSSPPGHNGLENGQWWPRQMCCKRDGAHNEPQQGISPVSIILAMSDRYELNEDYGDTIKYSSTFSEFGSLSRGTKYLLEAEQAETPIRVIRAKPGGTRDEMRHKYLPECGYRYDGLYVIQGHEVKRVVVQNNRTQTHVFTLKRIPGQDPIRYTGPEMRPNEADKEACDKLEKILRK